MINKLYWLLIKMYMSLWHTYKQGLVYIHLYNNVSFFLNIFEIFIS